VFIRSKRARVTAVALALLVLAGCSEETPGTAGPSVSGSTTDQPTSSTSKGSQAEAPAVKNPLHATKFVANPCLAVSPDQLQQFKTSKLGERYDSGDGVACIWQLGTDGMTTGSVSFFPTITNGLTQVYKQNATNFFKDGYFSPLEVDGYPAAYNEVADNRDGGQCNLSVGISDQSIFSVLIQGQENTDGCKAALNLAKAALKTIQGGQ
jgi:hypothetical protein